MNHGRVPVYGSPCGFRWPSEDLLDVHGCCLPPGHDEEAPQPPKHVCSCNATRQRVLVMIEVPG